MHTFQLLQVPTARSNGQDDLAGKGKESLPVATFLARSPVSWTPIMPLPRSPIRHHVFGGRSHIGRGAVCEYKKEVLQIPINPSITQRQHISI